MRGLTKIRAAARFCRAYGLFFSGLTWWAKWKLKREGAVIVLMLHRVLADSESANANSLRGTVLRDVTFERLSEFLCRHSELVDLGKGMPSWEEPAQRPRIAVTFDDGWRDNATTAFSITRRKNIPITIFVCPALMGRNRPFWPERVISLLKAACAPGRDRRTLLDFLTRLGASETVPSEGSLTEAASEAVIEALKRQGPEERASAIETLARLSADGDVFDGGSDATMSWLEVEHLRQSGVTFGSHTQSHQILPQISEEAIRLELSASKQEIENRQDTPCRLLAYPNGSVSTPVRQQAARAGYTLAFTTQCGKWTANTDPLLIPRVNMWEGKLAGPFGYFSRAMTEYALFWRPYRSIFARTA
jgi:peptidoglycan/xylan/chitin deacetylase (PgdA/CDA1 family)